MISIAYENPIATKIRLGLLMGSVSVKHFPRPFEFASSPERVGWKAGSLAAVQGRQGYSVVRLVADDVVPDTTLDVFEIRFATQSDNSGFIGYLAGRLKEVTGSGCIVLCGAESERIFDYYLVPTPVAPLARKYLDHLTLSNDNADFGISDRVFEVVGTTANSEITSETRFIFRDCDGALFGEYYGGLIEAGYIQGCLVNPGRYQFGYTQRNVQGEIAVGTSQLDVRRTESGRFKLTETYIRSDGRRGENRLIESRA